MLKRIISVIGRKGLASNVLRQRSRLIKKPTPLIEMILRFDKFIHIQPMHKRIEPFVAGAIRVT